VGAAPAVKPAFPVAPALRAAFIVVDEVLIAYAVAATHVRLFSAQLLSLLAMHLLDERPVARAAAHTEPAGAAPPVV
jgi:hypothetical protein